MAVLLNPLAFFGVLGFLFAVSIVISFLALNRDNKRKKIERLFEEVNVSKQELEAKIHDFNNELDTLRKELSLKNQMYEGLKSQYSELEKDLERLNQAAGEAASPKDKTQNPQTTHSKSPDSSQDSITNLLKSLNKS